MHLRLTNTMTGKKEDFTPRDPDRVSMYVCGPTVYARPHIGNARPAVVFDVLFRLLRHLYGADHVIYARNFTDVDDKINAAAAEQGVPIETITAATTAHYLEDMAALGVLEPDEQPRATAYIQAMIALAQKLIDAGHAYAAEGHVLFDVGSFPDYGALSRRNREDMIAGARVEVAPYKRSPEDFVLWKPSATDLPGWDSPWGRGRPGWHLECSAMIEDILGETIDIHGGGHDLTFPHHENEIAQSRCAHGGAALARYWVHNGFVNVDAEKMSKSLGNVLLVQDLLADHPGEAIRLALLGAHYRQPINWTADTPAEAARTLDKFYDLLARTAHVSVDAANHVPDAEFLAALGDDLNVPKAMSRLHRLRETLDIDATSAAKGAFLASAALLGIAQQDPADWFAHKKAAAGIDAAHVQDLVDSRLAARKAKDFAAADALRDELVAMGVVLKDHADGTDWSV